PTPKMPPTTGKGDHAIIRARHHADPFSNTAKTFSTRGRAGGDLLTERYVATGDKADEQGYQQPQPHQEWRSPGAAWRLNAGFAPIQFAGGGCRRQPLDEPAGDPACL